MATQRQKVAAKKISENLRSSKPKPVGTLLKEAGYSDSVSLVPSEVTKGKGFRELLDEVIPESLVVDAHKSLLRATKIEHMVFPLDVSDEEITELLASNGCMAKKFMHSETQTHVWYFVPDGFSRRAGTDMAYKLRGNYSAEKIEVIDVNERIKAIEEANKNDSPTKTRKQRVALKQPVQDSQQEEGAGNVSS